MKTTALMKCQLLDNDLLTMTKEAVATVKPFVDELILVDQASVVGQDWMKDTASKYIRNDISTGFPGFVDQGMKEATGDYVAVLNNDILFEENWMKPLVKLFSECNIGLVHPKMLSWNHPFEHGTDITYNPRPDEGMYFSAFVIDPRIYSMIGGWDTGYDFWGYDDWDYYYRLLKSGHNAILTNVTSYWHKGGATIDKIGRGLFVDKNRKYFTHKHGIDPHHIDWGFL